MGGKVQAARSGGTRRAVLVPRRGLPFMGSGLGPKLLVGAGEVAAAMHYGDNQNLQIVDTVDDAVGAEEELTMATIPFGDNTTELGKALKRLYCRDESLDKALS